MNKDSKIYVSGSNGMVGKNMVEVLKKAGFNNLITPSSSELDLRNQKDTEDFIKKNNPEYIFHFAAYIGGIMANINNPARYFYDNLIISTNIINAAYKYGVKNVLNLGSSCIYPRECKQPMKEEYLMTGPLEPTNEGYALAKIASLKLCEVYNKQYGTNFISLMPCNLYGRYERFDKDRSHVIAGLITKFEEAKISNKETVTLWGTGKARREFMYAEDIAKACLYFMEHYSANDLSNSFINIGSGKDISIKELAELIKDIVGFEGEILWDTNKPDGMPQKLLNVQQMEKFGFTPKTSLKEGLILTYDHYLKTQS